MDTVPIRLSPTLAHQRLCDLVREFKKTVNGIPKIDDHDPSCSIDDLAVFALNPEVTTSMLSAYKPVFLEVVSRWILKPELEDRYLDSIQKSTITRGAYVFCSVARILPIFPEAASLLEYFLANVYNPIGEKEWPAGQRLEVLLAAYRLLFFDRERFSPFINHLQFITAALSSVSRPEIYLALQIMGLYFQSSEITIRKWQKIYLGQDESANICPAVGQFDGIDNINYIFLPLLEAKRISNGKLLADRFNSYEGDSVLPSFEYSSLVSNMSGVLVINFNKAKMDYRSELVITKNCLPVMQDLVNALLSVKPILLTGPSGSGKTFYIDEISKYFKQDESLVRIHLGDQTDAKILIGTYSTGEKPGSFKWNPGILTAAVRDGRWILIEDIDKAPTEIISVLLPLLEKRELLIPSRGQVIKASSGFKIFATMTFQPSDRGTLPDLIGGRLWRHVTVKEPTNQELAEIIKFRFPMLEALAETFVETFFIVKSTFKDVRILKFSNRRELTSRDLVKWAKRVDEMLKRYNIKTSNSALPPELYEFIFADAIDCFAGFLKSGDVKVYAIMMIGKSLGISESRVQEYLRSHSPYISDTSEDVIMQVGRSLLQKNASSKLRLKFQNSSFAMTKHSARLIEQLAAAISMAEPLLLVGETGTGKTTVVQYLAKLLNKNITIINVSQQTEVGDLLGGYKPVDVRALALPLKEEFDYLFEETFNIKNEKNEKFIKLHNTCFKKKHWSNLVKLWKQGVSTAYSKKFISNDVKESPTKKVKLSELSDKNLEQRWKRFQSDVEVFNVHAKQAENSFLFNFVEGALVQAVRRGDWVLLDEINLASADTLESISDLLIESPSITLSEKGEVESIKALRGFRIFACMNPATDIGKRDLPAGLRSRFTELYVSSPDEDISDLTMIIRKYIGNLEMNDTKVVDDIAHLHLDVKRLCDANELVDGANQKPHFSVRTLSRTLVYARSIAKAYTLRRALYEGFCMSYLTLLDQKSEKKLIKTIEKYTLAGLKNRNSVISQLPPVPEDGLEYVRFKHYWLRRGSLESIEQPNYIITPFVEKNLLNLARATASGLFPVLIQGPTSSGKTSMIHYLARRTGHKFVRINNHEHTDLQEYLGSYVSDENGKLVFQEGILVEALRNGYWIVLDELNLAPTDVLEALNRLLDDNRELLIPETQEIVRPHPEFMLFATQNPPGIYGGRKILSRAFRNRFLELHFDDIPQDELETILKDRCQIAPSYAKKIVEVYRQLSVQRQSFRLFEQKNSFATLRDLFRWAGRDAVGYEQLALRGYMLLAERVRNSEEKLVVKETIEKVMRVKLNIDKNYSGLITNSYLDNRTVVWTKGMRRLLVLVCEALKNNEPVLLVGETGCGKTTICQVLSEATGKLLHIVNAHQNTETGDIIGAQRPLRNRSEIQLNLRTMAFQAFEEIDEDAESYKSCSLDELIKAFNSIDKEKLDAEFLEAFQKERNALEVLFEWKDGSLVQALRSGDFFLLDEISLADDSVLERLNSVLEPERTLLLAEKGSSDSQITAKEGFQFFATMNPGGDYGKKELSPALRNRFTEIWVPSMEDFDDVMLIIKSRLLLELQRFAKPMVKFGEWFGNTYGGASSGIISLRDMLSWVSFVNALSASIKPELSLFHGCCMVFIDSLGATNSASLSQSSEVLLSHRTACVQKLSTLLGYEFLKTYSESPRISVDLTHLHIGPFSLERVGPDDYDQSFNLNAPTTLLNALRVVRGMQAKRPVLLEGSPGVGKTSLVSSIADVCGQPLTRINLSEQTDLIDLFGSDAPADGKEAGEFMWRDAPFLRAMQKGDWVLLDEMNLASQSILEGLNACLDHRGEAYIPELDKTFHCHPNFRVFAAQNPQIQGGGRKGLPKSFVNRFCVVYMDSLNLSDLNTISRHLYPSLTKSTIAKLIEFVMDLEFEISVRKSFGHAGSPFEFNLRDTMRWLKLMSLDETGNYPFEYFELVIGGRFRTENDRMCALKLFEKHFGEVKRRERYFQIGEEFVQSGHSIIKRLPSKEETLLTYQPLQCNFTVLETAITCVTHRWPLILTGPTASGKTGLIRFLANVHGAELKELSMNGDIDSTDLLGGFDQVDIAYQIFNIFVEINLLSSRILDEAISAKDNSLIQVCGSIIDLTQSGDVANPEQLIYLTVQIETMPISDNDDIIKVKSLGIDVENLNRELSRDQSIKFRWFDGTLVKAVEQGHWLVLDNANLCNPSVLDRLNSLLEPNGRLIINECALEDGSPRVLVPHKDFRLFLTVDPKYGELSRAMRNRGVEVFIDELKTRATERDCHILGYPANRSTELSLVKSLDRVSLSGQESIVNKYPMSKMIKPTDFVSSYFAILEDISMMTSSEIAKFIPGKELDVMPLQLINMGGQWSETQNRYPGFSEGSIQQIHMLLKDEQVTYNSQIVELTRHLLSSFFTSKGISSFSGPLHPLVNSYAATNRLAAEKIAIVQEIHRGNSRLFEMMKELDQVAKTGKISEMTYLAKSAAHFTLNRPIKNCPTVPVFPLLEAIYLYGSEVVGKAVADRSLNMDYLRSAVEIQLLSSDIIKLTKSSFVDESQLHIYREILDGWSKSLPSTDDYSESTKILFKRILIFGQSLVLSRGTSMVSIWENSKPSYPTTEKSWELYDRLMKVCWSFDALSKKLFPDLYDTVMDIRVSVINTLLDTSGNVGLTELEAIISSLESAVNGLESLSSQFKEERTHLFQRAFTMLASLIEISTIEHSNDQDFSKLNAIIQYTDIPTVHLMLYKKVRAPYMLPVLRSILRNNPSEYIRSLISESNSESMLFEISTALRDFSNSASSHYTQASNDLTYLGRLVLENIKLIKSNRRQSFRQMLQECVCYINVIHESVDEKVRVPFDYISNSYFSPALRQLENNDLYSLGTAWVNFFLGIIQLYVPDIPFDPAMRQHVDYNRYLHHAKSFENELAAWKIVRRFFFGEEPNVLEDIMVEWSELYNPKVLPPSIFRPKQSQISSLYYEWNSFVKSDLSENVMSKLVSKDIDSSAEIALWQANSDQFIARISHNYKHYSDITSIFECFVNGLKLGLHFISLSREPVLEVSPYWIADVSTLANLGQIGHCRAKVQSLKHLSGLLFYKSMLSLLNGMEVYFKLQDSENFASLYTIADDIFAAFYQNWKIKMLKEKEEQIASSSIYKDNSEIDIEEELKRIFPDYESDEETSGHDEGSEMYYLLATSYLNLYGEDSSPNVSLTEATLKGVDIVQEAIGRGIENQLYVANSDQAVLPSFILSLHNSIKDSDVGKESNFNFYKDSSRSESHRVIDLCQKVKKTVSNLLDQWPEHSTLQNIKVACDELMVYPVFTPVAKFLQKVDQIYTFLNEWETYASREVSLASLVHEIAGLIIDWRRMELKTWSGLFEAELRTSQKEIGRWWFHLYESIIIQAIDHVENAENKEFPLSELVQALTIFLSDSSIGQFDKRLALLKAFGNHVHQLAEKYELLSSLGDAIYNVEQFYAQFKRVAAERISNGTSQLRKEMQDVLLLASWKDVNASALRESARKSHHKLFKLVRKFRSLIGEKVTVIIDEGLKSSAPKDITYNYTPIAKNMVVADHLKLCGTLEVCSSRPARIMVKNIYSRASRIHSYVSKLQEISLPTFEDFTIDVLEEIRHLQKETPSVLTKENKKLVTSLKAEKSKLLSDSLKFLNKAGLKGSVKAEVLSSQALLTTILTCTPFLKKDNNEDEYFFKILELLPKVRIAVRTEGSDVPVDYLRRGMAMVENFVSSILKARSDLSNIMGQSDKLENVVKYMETLCSMIFNDTLSNEQSLYCKVRSMVIWVPELVSFTESVLRSVQHISQCRSDNLERLLSKIVLTSRDFKKRLDGYEILHNSGFNLNSSNIKALVDEIQDQLGQFISSLLEVKDDQPELELVADLLAGLIRQKLSALNCPRDKTPATRSLQNLESEVRLLCDSVFGVTENITKLIEVPSAKEDWYEEDGWFRDTQDLISRLNVALSKDQILANFSSCIKTAVQVGSNGETDAALAVFGSAFPLVYEYMEFCNVVKFKMLMNYSKMTKSLFILMSTLHQLATSGFCSPREENSDMDDQDLSNAKDGTGLGDGAGEKNNSEDVDQDEDITENAQKPNDERESDNEQDVEDDTAVDIEGDMAGELEDAPDNEKDEENDEEGDEEDVEDEVGSIDELDPNQIDEKMWDDDDDKSGEGQKKSDSLSGQADNDDLQGVDDDQSQADNGDDQNEDNNGDDGEEEQEEEDVGEQEDNVQQQDLEELEPQAKESEILELPEDMNLDNESDVEGNHEEEGENLPEEEDFPMDNNEQEHEMDIDDNDNDNDEPNNDIEDADMIEANVDETEEDHEKDRQEESDNREEDDAHEMKDESDANPSKDSKTDVDGLHGPSMAEDEQINNELDVSSAQKSSSKSEGADEAAAEEKDNVGMGDNATNVDKNTEDSSDDKVDIEDRARNEVSETIKQLGDALKEFHQRRQEIQQSSVDKEESSEDKANKRLDEFEHVEGEDSSYDTQALGSASHDQIQNMNDDMMIDDEEEADPENHADGPRAEESQDIEEVEQMEQDFGSSVGRSVVRDKPVRSLDAALPDDEDRQTEDMDLDEDNAVEPFADSNELVPPRDIIEAQDLWKKYELSTNELSLGLCEQLRLILEPTQATKLRGDFKTGKRLNMKRIIPYIASQFKKDKIWMRRTKPSKRQYQIMIAVDDSKSMSESRCVDLAFQTIALVSKALTQLEAGQLAITRFGETSQVVHSFQKPFTSESGAEVFQWFGFHQKTTDVGRLLQESIKLFEQVRFDSRHDVWQLQVIISDGLCEDHARLQRLVRQAQEKKIMIVFVVVDGINKQGTILDLTSVKYLPDEAGNLTRMQMERYLDTFPFDYYVIVRDIRELPGVLSLVLRQYFTEVSNM